MNYTSLFLGLMGEIKANKQYNVIGKPLNIFAFIAVLPFTILAAFASLYYLVCAFFFNGIASAVKYLEKWVEEKKKDVHPATEAVLFFVTMPTIFFFNVLLSGFAVFFYFIWFVLQCFTYIATLGGIKWQPFIMEAKFDDNLVATTKQSSATTFAIVDAILLVGAIVSFSVVGYDDNLGFISTLFNLGYFVYTLAGVCSIFKKEPYTEPEETTEEAPAETTV